MRFFPVLMIQHAVIGTAIGIIVLIAIYLAWKGYPHDRPNIDDPAMETQAGFVPDSEHHPVTPFLLFFYVAVALWVVGYVVFVGILGGRII
jgi:uncharacterized membrane protein YozB (DUF420 family)